MLRNLVNLADRAYRRTGANLPLGDPRPTHGALMEGYFWRVTDSEAHRVVVVLCGVNQHPDGAWATVAVAAHPGGFVRSAVVDAAWASAERLEIRAGDVVRADDGRVTFDLGADARVDFEIGHRESWPKALGGGGLFSALPFLSQYWHPHNLGGRATGSASVGGERWRFESASVYAEKNWGRGFPDRWWWGEAHDFTDDVCVAFGGGDLHFGNRRLSVGGLAARVGSRVIRLAPPTGWVSCEVAEGRWRVRGRHPRYDVTIEGDGTGEAPHVLPVPRPDERRNVNTDLEHLAAHMDVEIRRGSRPVYRGTSALAGLEVGSLPR